MKITLREYIIWYNQALAELREASRKPRPCSSYYSLMQRTSFDLSVIPRRDDSGKESVLAKE